MVFVYVDWTTEELPRPFYVGKGNTRRLRVIYRNRLHENIRKKYGFDRRIALEVEHEDVAFVHEQELIVSYKTYALGGDGYWGANFTLGGDGPSGYRHTDDARRRIGESRIGRKCLTEEGRAAISRAHRGKIVREDTKKAISISTKTWWANLTETQRQDYRDARNKNRPVDSAETRQKRSESLKLFYARRRNEDV